MSIKILTKSGEEITAIDDARAYNFDAGNKSGIVKGALNEGKLFLVSSNVIGLDSCELRISGHRIVIDSAESITMANRPSVATRYSMIAEVVVSDASVPSFRLFIQPAKTELIQQNLYKTLNGNGTYQLRIGNFTLGTDGLISDIVRTADVISGATNGFGDIEFNVTTETIAGDLEPEVNVDFNEETKKYDMHFALPLSNGTSVIENGEVVKRFNADSKVDKEEGKGLSTNDFTTAEKNKLESIEDNANYTVVDTALSTTSENPVQNKVVANAVKVTHGYKTLNSNYWTGTCKWWRLGQMMFVYFDTIVFTKAPPDPNTDNNLLTSVLPKPLVNTIFMLVPYTAGKPSARMCITAYKGYVVGWWPNLTLNENYQGFIGYVVKDGE